MFIKGIPVACSTVFAWGAPKYTVNCLNRSLQLQNIVHEFVGSQACSGIAWGMRDRVVQFVVPGDYLSRKRWKLDPSL